MMSEPNKKKFKFATIALVLGGIVIGLLAALPTTEVLHYFSTNEYCATCHTMKPVSEAFAKSIHGGNNKQGFVAECVDCHLPKSNVVHELYVKGTSGLRHLWGEYVLGMELLDYDKLHPKRTEYVFDSGCINCHKKIEERAKVATAESSIADQTHKLSFANKAMDTSWNCSSCHYDIAHPGLKQDMQNRHESKMRELAIAALGEK